MPRPTSYADFCLKKKIEPRRRQGTCDGGGERGLDETASIDHRVSPGTSAGPLMAERNNSKEAESTTTTTPQRSSTMSSSLTINAATIVAFFFKDAATTEIYTLSLHDALPIYGLFSNLTHDF